MRPQCSSVVAEFASVDIEVDTKQTEISKKIRTIFIPMVVKFIVAERCEKSRLVETK
jgi:hypothetical protein